MQMKLHNQDLGVCLQCAGNSGAHMSCIGWKEPRQPKIRNFGGEILVKKNVARLYVPVDNGWSDFLMEKCKSTGNTHSNFDACPPVEPNVTIPGSCNGTHKTSVSMELTKIFTIGAGVRRNNVSPSNV